MKTIAFLITVSIYTSLRELLLVLRDTGIGRFHSHLVIPKTKKSYLIQL